MTDAAAPPPAPPFPAADGPNPFRVVYGYLSGRSLLARALLLAVLTLALEIPLGLVGGVIADRQRYESEAAGNIAGAKRAYGQHFDNALAGRIGEGS